LVETAADLDIRFGWRLNDPRLEADAIAFWERLGHLPPGADPGERAKEIVLGAYKDDALVGVQTAQVATLGFLRVRFAMLRSSVDPEARRGHVAATMGYATRTHLESWAAAHPEERLAGTAAVLESPQLTELARTPYWPGTGLLLAGHTKEGRQIRVCWFGHYRLDPPDAALPRPRIDPARDLEVRPGWRLDDSELEADAIAFWERLGNLPRGVDPAARAKELICGCYRDGRLIGVATAELFHLESVRARFAMLRAAIDPEERRSHAATTMTYYARNFLDKWSAAHPEEKLAGLGAVLEARELSELGREPSWPESGLTVIGFTPQGQQVRVSWFDHYRLD
jgi:hypothetical protein